MLFYSFKALDLVFLKYICLHAYKKAFYEDNTLHILGIDLLLMYVNSFCACIF
jgi:hypothetical protein